MNERGVTLARVGANEVSGADAPVPVPTSLRAADVSRIFWESRYVRTAVRVVSVLSCVLAWQWASTRHMNFGVVSFRDVPAPTEVVGAAWSLIGSGKLLQHLRNSLFRVFVGFALAAISGTLGGLVIGRSKLAEDTVFTPLELLRPIPGVAWIPLAILMFPSSEGSMVFITYMGALFPILLNTIHGVEGVDARLITASRSLGARRWNVFREVVLPGSLPSIVTGLSIGMGTAWFCLVTAEMIAGQYGIGYYTWESYNLQNYPGIVVGMVFIGAFGMLSSMLVKRIGGWLMPWYRLERKSH
jgi:NitT/TauT family transport system permease protein